MRADGADVGAALYAEADDFANLASCGLSIHIHMTGDDSAPSVQLMRRAGAWTVVATMQRDTEQMPWASQAPDQCCGATSGSRRVSK